MKILITGATGFVGKNLIEHLLKDDHQLTITSSGAENQLPDEVYDFPICQAARKHKVLYYSLEGIDWKCVYGQDAVIHLAANNDTRCQDESEMLRANLYGPIGLFTKAAQGGCKNFVYASSTAVYGNEESPYVEGLTPEKPLNLYGDSKKRFEDFAMKFAEESEVKVVGLRYCNIYGPGEEHKGKRMSMIGQLFRKMMKGEKPTLFKSGEQRRDWVYVEDVVDANMLAISSEESGIYNIGSGVATSFNELIYEIDEVIGVGWSGALPPNYIDCPFEDEYQSHTCCNIEKAKSHLGYQPKHDLATGLNRYFEYLNRS